jgi:hypothetical protein
VGKLKIQTKKNRNFCLDVRDFCLDFLDIPYLFGIPSLLIKNNLMKNSFSGFFRNNVFFLLKFHHIELKLLMKNKRKKQFFLEEVRSQFYYRRFGHLSDHYQYNKRGQVILSYPFCPLQKKSEKED